MKDLLVKRILIAVGFALSAPVWAAQKTATLSVQDMSCATCPIAVKMALMKLGGVVNVTSNLAKKQTTVVYDDAHISLESLTQATKDAGFPSTVTGVKP
jgi:mercuric ion binding protein